jgi:hypothetical protein
MAASAAAAWYALTNEAPVVRGRYTAVNLTRLSRITLIALTLAIVSSVVVRAQVSEGVLSVDNGKDVSSIARLIDGRWVGDTTCVAGEKNPSAQVRLKGSDGLQLVPIRPVTPASPEWLRLVPTIVQLFERRERDQRLQTDRTSSAPRAVDFIYAAEEGDRRRYYFEASRRVASASADVDHDIDPPGTLRIAVAGFLDDGRDGLVPLGTKSELHWEQDGLPAGPSRPDLIPLGLVRHGNQSVWVMNGRTGDRTWFTLYDVTPSGTRTLLTTRGSGC